MEYLHAELRGVHEFRDLAYTREEGSVVACDLCCTGAMYPRQRHEHFHGQKHARKYNNLARAQAAAREEEEAAHALRARTADARKLLAVCPAGVPGLVRAVKAHLFDYVMNDDFTAKHRAARAMTHFVERERMTLLELAALRSAILRVFPGGLEEMREQPVLDPAFNPSQFMHGLRASTGVNTVMERVSDFLA
jgi:hypothetical protein